MNKSAVCLRKCDVNLTDSRLRQLVLGNGQLFASDIPCIECKRVYSFFNSIAISMHILADCVCLSALVYHTLIRNSSYLEYFFRNTSKLWNNLFLGYPYLLTFWNVHSMHTKVNYVSILQSVFKRSSVEVKVKTCWLQGIHQSSTLDRRLLTGCECNCQICEAA